MYSTGEMDKLRCWDLDSGEELWATHGGVPVAISPDGRTIAVGGPNPVRLYDARDGSQVQALDQMGIWSLAFTPDGQQLIGGGNDASIHIWAKIPDKDRRRSRIFKSASWFEELVQYFVDLGFFEDIASSETSERDADIRKRFRDEFGREVPNLPRSNLAHMKVLAQDRTRVWWNDLEADVSSGNKVYIRTLEALGHISLGYFEPVAIEETWSTETGPISVRFELSGAQIELNPEYGADYIDIRILDDLNKLLQGTPIRFEMITPFDQTAYVVTLTIDQKQKLSNDLGWTFVDS